MDTEVRFEVEQAGCESCAARVRAALAPVLEIDTLEIDEGRDVAAVSGRAVGDATVEAVDQLLAHASVGAGHAYTVRSGSWHASPSRAD
jgi:hypothetical protein